MFNSGIRGKRASDGTGFLSTQEQFVQKTFTIPTITSFSVVGSDDLALDPAGGQTVEINGSGFTSGATVVVGGASIGVVTFIDSTKLTFTSPTKSSGSYTVFVSNPNGGTAILTPGLVYSGLPTFTTDAGSLGSYYETTEIDEVIEATEGEDPITYTIVAGSLPTGATLNSAGYITGTSPVDESSNTYTFTVQATDAENQDSTREFSLTINVDVVTWSSPSDGVTIDLVGNEEMTNVTLLATSAAGYDVNYTANTLPTGVLLSGNTVYGTPNTEETVVTTFTATSNTTNRSATRTVTWVVLLGDVFFNQTTLLLNADNNTFITDASDNAFTITPVADTRPSAFSPYNSTWSFNSNSTNSTGARFTTPALVQYTDFTIEFWAYNPNNSNQNCRFSQGSSGLDFYIKTDGRAELTLYAQIVLITSSSTLALNKWHHIAVTRESDGYRMFVNGVQVGYNSRTDINFASTNTYIGSGAGNDVSVGYISNFRMVQGNALYSDGYTVPTEPLTDIDGTVLLTANSNRVKDSSDPPTTVISVGSKLSVTSFGPFTETDTSTGSGYFDGSGDYLTGPTGNSTLNNALDILGGDYTIEFWLYKTADTSAEIATNFTNLGVNGWELRSREGGAVAISHWVNNNETTVTSLFSQYSINTWNHIAVVKNSGNYYFYVNGVDAGIFQNGSRAAPANGGAGTGLGIGAYIQNLGYPSYLTGYISDLRIVKGTAVYTADFDDNLPTAPLTAITNTSLLTLQSRIGYNNHQFSDRSIANNPIIRSGNTSSGSFSPFVPSGWSGYFDGTGEYLTAPTNAAFSFDGNFTVETWLYPTAFSNYKGIYSNTNAINSTGFHFGLNANGNIFIYYNGGFVVTSSNAMTLNAWNHVAVVRNSGVVYIYINGSVSTNSWTTSASFTNAACVIGTNPGPGTEYYFGYISNLRIVKGTAVYTADFDDNLPTAPLEPISGTSLLTLRGPSFTDDGPNRFDITRNGDTKITPFSPFAPHTRAPDSHSVYFDGTGDYLTSGTSTAYTLGTGDFTIEAWLYNFGYAGSQYGRGWCTLYPAGGYNTTRLMLRLNNGYNAMNMWLYINPTVYFGGAGTNSTALITPYSWTHVAFVRQSGTFKLYINGTLDTTISGVTIGLNFDTVEIGRTQDGSVPDWNGYISNLRIVKGTVVYTGNFTPPTAPLTTTQSAGTNIAAITGTSTSLLTCQSPTVIDNSTNALAITVNGNSQPTKFNPFGETVTTGVEYSSASHGGSVYFDGNDYLQAPAGQNWNFGSGPFTMEAWVYPSISEENSYNLFSINQNGSNQWSWAVTTYNNWGMYFYWGNYGSSQTERYTNGYPIKGQWNHVVVCRDASYVWRFFINGVLYPTAVFQQNNSWSDSRSLNNTGINPRIGEVFTGYMTDVRVTKGASLYQYNFVPPIAPSNPTPSDTLFTCNNTAAIQDKTGRNVLETAGNVRVVNGVKKFGSGAIAFDGTQNELVTPYNPALAPGSGDFTIECWLYPIGNTNYMGFYQNYTDGNGRATALRMSIYQTDNTRLAVQTAATALIITSTGVLQPNAWNHIALVRNGAGSNNLVLYVNGVSAGTATNTTNFSDGIAQIGNTRYAGTNYYFNGYIDDLRITKGVARTITLPSSAFRTK